MSARSRVPVRVRNPSSNSSNATTPNSSRANSNNARERSSPYSPLIRRSKLNQNKSSSSTTQRSKEAITTMNNPTNSSISISQSSKNEFQQTTVADGDDDVNVEVLENMSDTGTQTNNVQSTSVHTALTDKFSQNLGLNDSRITTSILLRDPSRPKDLIDNDAVYQLFDTTISGLYRCKLCQQELKSQPYYTTNLRKHLGLVHKRVQYLYPSQQKNYSSKSNSIPITQKKQLHSAVISCIIQDSRSFDDFRKPGMRKFLSVAVPGYIPPHRATIKANLLQRYRHHRRSLRTVLAKVPEVALTSDVWQNSRGTHFISLTAHFFDRKYQNISLTIGFRQLVGSHIADRLRKYILYELNSLNIQHKVCAITTDNGSNIVCATANTPCFSTRLSCLGHDLNLIVNDGLHLHEAKKKNEESRPDSSVSSKTKKNPIETIIGDDDDIDYSSSDEEKNEEQDEEEVDEEEGNVSVPGGSDSTHDEESDNDSFDDGIEGQSDDHTPLTNDIVMDTFNLVNRTRDFVRMTRRTYFIRDYLKQEAQLKKLQGEGLILDCKIRWNSSFYMIKRFINYQDVINDITLNPRIISSKISQSLIYRLKSSNYSHDEWVILTAVRNVLSAFEEACRLISGRRYQTLSIGYLILVGLEYHLCQPKDVGPLGEIEFILRKSLYDSFRYHVNDKVNFDQKRSMMIACFLDTQTHNQMNDIDKDQAQDFIMEEVRVRNLSYHIMTLAQSSTTTAGGASSTNPSNKRENQLSTFLSGCGLNSSKLNSTNIPANKTIKEELAFYIGKVKSSPIFEEFWTTYESDLPCLSTLVRSFNIRPATSVASESLFSIASYVHRKQRSSLSPDTLRYSMLLRDSELLTSLM